MDIKPGVSIGFNEVKELERPTIYGIIASAIAVLALGIAASVALAPRVASTVEQETSAEDLIYVTGTATATVSPDLAIVYLTVQEKAETSAEALRLASEQVRRVVDILKSLGVSDEDMKTTGFSIFPEYQYYDDGRPPKLVGFVATYSLEVRTLELGNVGRLIDSAVSAGVDIVNGVSLTISDDLSGRLSRELLAAAMTDAKRKAELAISPLGLKVARLKSVSIMEQYPYPVMRSAPAGAEATTMPIIPGQTTFTVSVQATFVISSS